MTSKSAKNCSASGGSPLLYLFYGEEQYLVGRAAKKIIDDAVPDMKDFNLSVYFGNDCTGIEVLDSCLTLPMFADKRAVLVKRAEGLNASALENLSSYVKNPCGSTILVLSALKVDMRKKFFADFKKYGSVNEFKRLQENRLSAFIKEEASRLSVNIDGAAANLLALLVGSNLQELVSQMEKLSAYTGASGKISIEDVKIIASETKEYSAFELASALGSRSLPDTFKRLDMLSAGPNEMPMVLGALVKNFRQLWSIRDMLDNRMSSTEIGRSLNIHSYFLDDKLKQARKFNTEEFRKIFFELERCDRAAKSGGDPHIMLQRLAYTVCRDAIKP